MAYLSNDALLGMTPSISIDDYQTAFNLPVGAFYNVNNPAEQRMSCRTFWSQSNRESLAQYLALAEVRRENELGFHLGYKQVLEEQHSTNRGRIAVLSKKHFVSAGYYDTTVIEEDVALTLSSGITIIDPVVLTVSTSVTNPSEIILYHQDTSHTIKPSSVTISSGVATIKIPRSRLVKISLLDNRDEPLEYEDDDNFVSAVDVVRKYINTTHGYLQWSPVETAYSTTGSYPTSAATQQSIYVYTASNMAKKISSVKYFPATYNGSSFTGSAQTYSVEPSTVLFNYISGVPLSIQNVILTARLAHNMMPYPPCDCADVDMIWKNDRAAAGNLCPYGTTIGALEVWLHDSRNRIGIGGAL